MLRNTIAMLALALTMAPPAFAREDNESGNHISRLSIGDTVPDILLTDVSGTIGGNGQFLLSDFRGRLVIIDFWSIGCGACFKAFPKMDSLQEIFGDSIQVIVATKNPADKVTKYLAGMKKQPRFPEVPSVVGDTAFAAMFFHITVPHHVWVDGAGVVRQITGGHNTTATAIRNFLAGGREQLPLKDEPEDPVEREVPQIRADPLVNYYSYARKADPRVLSGGTGWVIDPATRRKTGISIDATAIADIYKMAWYGNITGPSYWLDNRVVIESPYPEKYVRPADITAFDKWRAQNAYGYYLKVPVDKAGQLFEVMRQEITKIFGLKASVERRRVMCWGLVVTDSLLLPSTSGKVPSHSVEGDTTLLRNQPVSLLAQILAYRLKGLPEPVADMTSLGMTIDITISLPENDIASANRALTPYGLRLIRQEAEKEMLVLRE